MTATPAIPSLDALGRALEYPGADLAARWEACRAALTPAHPAAARRVADALDRLAVSSTEEFEEIYARAFDLSPACAPYVTVHLFGEESFKRGELMARLRERYAAVGFASGAELPDHVATLLRYAARAEREEAGELAQYCLMTPLARMADALGAENPYGFLLRAAEETLREEFSERDPAPLPIEQMRLHGGASGCGEIAAPASACATACGVMVDASNPKPDLR
ncbi:MAG: molecular chaperone TorD family protein [Verrucomicrobiae bacterium]|nr:molecular chaperone TorD family protein [Verrucomicrobiae bacterium]